jgi:hypothetical protein
MASAARPVGRPKPIARGPRPVVFLGPSLPRAEAEAILDADYRPPVRRGDLDGIGPARTVVVIDGEFRQNLAVSPGEILRLLADGIRVVGASSMGALRAAETRAHGMIGVGRIYEWYASGEIEGDDEVAVAYCPDRLTPLTVPLVHVRAWLRRATDSGTLTHAEARMLLRRTGRIFYEERTPRRLERLIAESLDPARLDAMRSSGVAGIPDVKSDDARLALGFVRLSPSVEHHLIPGVIP